MHSFAINGDAREMTAEQIGVLVDIAARIMMDASRPEGVEFTVESVDASVGTVVWQPQMTDPDVDLGEALTRIAHRIDEAVTMLETDQGIPDWMAAATANSLYRASRGFGEGGIDGVSFDINGHTRTMTRRAYRTLDRVLHERTNAIGSASPIEATPAPRRVTVAEMSGALAGGPDSVTWLREQRRS